VNLADTLRALLRRWYIVVPGLILAVVVAIGAGQMIKPDYERTGTQLLLPGTASIPEAGNPYLYLGGLSQAADVLVTTMSSANELDPILDGHPGAEIVVSRDPATSGPMLLTRVTARTDADAQQILTAVIARTEHALDNLQDVDGITAGNRIGIKTITLDEQSTLQQKTRLLGVVGSGLAVGLLALLVAALVDGLSTRRRRRAAPASSDAGAGSVSRLSAVDDAEADDIDMDHAETDDIDGNAAEADDIDGNAAEADDIDGDEPPEDDDVVEGEEPDQNEVEGEEPDQNEVEGDDPAQDEGDREESLPVRVASGTSMTDAPSSPRKG
jgi:hypothetical protein